MAPRREIGERPANGYWPIAEYGLVGGTHSAALIARDGSIDWACLPHFDSPPLFARLLDARRGGTFRVGPPGACAVERRYLDDTAVLETTFHRDDGVFRLTDFMPAEPAAAPEDHESAHAIWRRVEVLSGAPEIEIVFDPRPGFGRAPPRIEARPFGFVAVHDDTSVALECSANVRAALAGAPSGRVRLSKEQEAWLFVGPRAPSWTPSAPVEERGARRLASAIRCMRAWASQIEYDGEYGALVRRSALTLKLLTFEPTGAIVASPTTSLPECIGGVRNWDYRYAWLRDAALTLYALKSIGHHEEAQRFFDWYESTLGEGDEPRLMYRIDGGAPHDERDVDELEGYRGSRPVRVGNAAKDQLQIDIYGELVDAAQLGYVRGNADPRRLWPTIVRLADAARHQHDEPDEGIWEIRIQRRHHVHSKVMCWVALDRAIRIAEQFDLDGPLDAWRAAASRIREDVLAKGWHPEIGAFTQVFGGQDLDASVLTLPLVGFIPATDPRMRSTIARIDEALGENGLVHRYRNDDGLPGREGAFGICSFWMVDALALSGEVEAAQARFERVTSFANDLGLLSEEIDPKSGVLLGNFPQGLSHLGLIRSAIHVTRALRGGPEHRATIASERVHSSARR